MKKERFKVSAMVVGRNEALKLDECLKSISWCDEIIYGDLNSTDNSIEIAGKYSARIFKFDTFGPSGEYTQSELLQHVIYEWVLIIDPDEVVDLSLRDSIYKIIEDLNDDHEVGSILLPWKFYFGRYALKGTVWGGEKYKEALFRRNRFIIEPITHYGRRLVNGYTSTKIAYRDQNVLHHFWMDNISSFLNKHKRYLKNEGRDRYEKGDKISLKDLLLIIPKQLFVSFFSCRGYKDGFLGIFLSIFWSYYCFVSGLSLYKITRKERKSN